MLVKSYPIGMKEVNKFNILEKGFRDRNPFLLKKIKWYVIVENG